MAVPAAGATRVASSGGARAGPVGWPGWLERTAGEAGWRGRAVPIEWTSSLQVGVEEIDEQHRELFRRAARLVNALKVGDRTEVEPLMRYLSDYVVSHFECEERWMAETEYPGLETHRDTHRRFRDDLREMMREYQRKGPTALVALTVSNWLGDWLRTHIGGPDVELARWLSVRGEPLRR